MYNVYIYILYILFVYSLLFISSYFYSAEIKQELESLMAEVKRLSIKVKQKLKCTFYKNKSYDFLIFSSFGKIAGVFVRKIREKHYDFYKISIVF